MFNISDYFKKFSKIEGDSLVEKDAIRIAIYNNCGIDKVQFEVRKDILYIKGPPMLKSMIYTKKASIVAAIRESLPKTRITDIR
jgi:Asp/Glu/hydantoin racemase